MSAAEAARSPRVVAIGRTIAGLAALAAWLALGLQLALLLKQMAGEGLAAGLWRYFGFYTILTNLAVAVVASLMAARPSLAGPRLRLTTVTSIAFVGLVYSLALRALWRPTGWQAVSDHALHDVTPLLFIVAWLLASHGSLKWRDALWTLAPPLAYCLYALARGAADGWYAYWFLNPRTLAPPALAASVALLAVAALVLGLAMTAVDRRLGRRSR